MNCSHTFVSAEKQVQKVKYCTQIHPQIHEIHLNGTAKQNKNSMGNGILPTGVSCCNGDAHLFLKRFCFALLFVEDAFNVSEGEFE